MIDDIMGIILECKKSGCVTNAVDKKSNFCKKGSENIDQHIIILCAVIAS